MAISNAPTFTVSHDTYTFLHNINRYPRAGMLLSKIYQLPYMLKVNLIRLGRTKIRVFADTCDSQLGCELNNR